MYTIPLGFVCNIYELLSDKMYGNNDMFYDDTKIQT